MAIAELPFGKSQERVDMETAAQLLGMTGKQEKIGPQLRSGLSYKAMRNLVDATGFSMKEIAKALDIAQSTLANQRKGGCLNATVSDKLYRFAQIFAMAETMNGNAKEAHDWLTEKAAGLDGVAPIDRLSNTHDVKQVEELIQGIMWGMGA